METTTILANLREYLPQQQVDVLSMHVSAKTGIFMCLAINNILKNYTSTPANEKIVSNLLYKLCKNHFV